MTASPASAPSSQLVRRDGDPGVVTLTLTAPQNRNALGLAMIDTLIVDFADSPRTKRRVSWCSPARGRRSARDTTYGKCRRIGTIPTAGAVITST